MDNLYFRKRLAKLWSDKIDSMEVTEEDRKEIDRLQDYLFANNANSDTDIEQVKKEIYKSLSPIDSSKHRAFFSENERYIWGIRPEPEKTIKIQKNIPLNNKMYIIEDSFLRSVSTVTNKLSGDNNKYFNSCGYTIDDLSHYVDATRPSRMELTLNSDWEINDEQLQRVRKLIKSIVSNKVTKYNHQPIFKPDIGRKGVEKVLVIDQAYGDYSIIKGMANDSTFEKMLDKAIKDNPNSDIIIKTHPDALGKVSLRPKCYYQNIKLKDNLYRLTDAINPISLLEYVDKVYVCSSQFGFEALMCGKEVNTFGMPFYAGWGLTKDVKKCDRRTRTRTLEEVFYIAYIMFSLYINPNTSQPCEIEDAIDLLIEHREKYFKEKNSD